MKITKIIKNKANVYSVTKEPNYIERLFGVKRRIHQYKDTGEIYMSGGGRVYIDQRGYRLSNHIGYGSDIRKSIDLWRNKF